MAGLESVWLRHPDLNPDPQAIFQRTLQQAVEAADFGGSDAEAEADAADLERYQFDASAYITDRLGWTPWAGTGDTPGQLEVIRAYELALRQQTERWRYELGEIGLDELQSWQPGQVIQNRIRVEAGHTVGKTKLSSGLVNHFFDNFIPSIIYTFAPSWIQIHDLLWKEIKADRGGKGLPGRILDLELNRGPDHFAKGRATSDAGGKGTERVHGQHGRYLMFVLDEAEGIPDFIWGAVDSMMSGGICIMLMLANPRTQTSKFHEAGSLSTVTNFRISCINHPNVTQGREVVPGAVRREYVETMLEKHCEIVPAQDPDQHTFTLPFPVRLASHEHAAGTIFKPNPEFLFRVLGEAPGDGADNTLIPVGRYEAACKRAIGDLQLDGNLQALRAVRLGIDVARWGKDYGTLYCRYQGRVWRGVQLWKEDTNEYAGAAKTEALRIWNAAPARAKPTSLHIRIDGGGGFGGGVVDVLKHDPELKEKYPDFRVLEVHFNGTPHNGRAYYDCITEMYGEAAESIKGLRIENAPNELKADLCERTYGWANREGIAVKRIEPKDDFKARKKRSCDDGDGFLLCVAPDHILGNRVVTVGAH